MSSRIVASADTTIEPRQPSRFEKKKNIVGSVRRSESCKALPALRKRGGASDEWRRACWSKTIRAMALPAGLQAGDECQPHVRGADQARLDGGAEPGWQAMRNSATTKLRESSAEVGS